VFEVRAAREGFAARLAALRATEAELEGIRAIHQTYIDTVRGSNRGHLVEHNDEFHEAVIAASRHRLLAEQIHRNGQYYFIHSSSTPRPSSQVAARIAGFLSDEEVRVSIEGQNELVRALMTRDADLSEQAARTHVLEGLAKVLNKIR